MSVPGTELHTFGTLSEITDSDVNGWYTSFGVDKIKSSRIFEFACRFCGGKKIHNYLM